MSDWVVITGVKPWDGRYELDWEGAPFTTRELGWLKKFAGYVPIEVDRRAFGDAEFISVLALVALCRADKIEPGDVPDMWDRFQDVPFGSAIRYEFGKAERDDAEDPPAERSNGNEPSSGTGSQTGSGSLADPLSPTGHRSSATSPSDQPTLVN